PPHLDAPLLPECEVSAKHAGKAIRFTYHPNQESLLVAISKRGLDAPQACRGGVCGSCRALISEGEVSVDQDFALTQEEKEKGWVLCCQATPKTSKLGLTFKEGR
ncbi:MAG: 2Fe-2S iron-sulfur cluster-binding protein, partial [Bacteroidota bacterium]|nr:2Fe-2S iron-sulfur cluster-binding protein [Bacteroidota bacterium]